MSTSKGLNGERANTMIRRTWIPMQNGLSAGVEHASTLEVSMPVTPLIINSLSVEINLTVIWVIGVWTI